MCTNCFAGQTCVSLFRIGKLCSWKRMNGIQKVRSSILLCSTSTTHYKRSTHGKSFVDIYKGFFIL